MNIALRCDPDNNVYCVVVIINGDEIYCPVEKSMYDDIRAIPSGGHSIHLTLWKPIFQFEGREHLLQLSLAGKQFEIPVNLQTWESLQHHNLCELT